MSDFHIGRTPPLAVSPAADLAAAKRYVEIDRSGTGSATRWHRGYAPVYHEDGTLAGGVWLELGEERGLAVPRGGAPEFLTNYPRERSENHYRKLVISEYVNGKMATSSDETFPIDRPLPASLTPGGWWMHEVIAGSSFESFYLPLRSGVEGAWVALSLEDLGIQWHLYSYVRSLLFYGLFVLLPVLVYMLAANRRLFAALSRFKTRLTFAVVLVSLVPIGFLAVYNKSYVEGRVRESDLRRLREQTQIGLNVMQRQIGTATPFSLRKLTDEQCIALAEQWGTDFNVYAGSTLQAGSRPEVVTAELLDTRLSADAYAAVVLQRHGFFSEEQSIGRLPYLVGYRPILSDDGRVVGTFAVPTLFRQREIDEMATRRNIFLFGTYALALLIAIALGTVVVNQVSKPILRLKEATGQVAAGHLDLRVRSGRRDEIGELEEAFDEMTANLKQSQDEIVKTQRELAWREMARQVAHEIKNPLTPMRLSIQHLQQAYADRVEDFGTLLNRITATMIEQIDALSRIASEFSSFARMPPRSMQPCSVHAIVRDVVTLFQQEKLTFTLALDADTDVVRADPDELRRVVINILRNAVQAMNGRGSVSIRTSSAAGSMTVRIEDSGPGIPEELRGRLFEPNFSTKSEGMGLGLAIVKRAVEDMGGSVAVESALGKGTAMILRMPLVNA
jgi:signal transduction histidine kinase